jgi:hypothetical protein
VSDPTRSRGGFTSKTQARLSNVAAAGSRWADAFHVLVAAARRLVLGRRSKVERSRSALVDIDPADLSELGRDVRRVALYETWEAQRRVGQGTRPDNKPDRRQQP